ncbi:MAG: sel1 repeat family protein, partial [Alphaproteobacteria bacterium]|nr:sel1 repeat family protein [Alphaproteobacteria bacterium]
SMGETEKKAVRDMSAKTLSPEELARAQALVAKCRQSQLKNCD